MSSTELPPVSGKQAGPEEVGANQRNCMVKVYPDPGKQVGIEQARRRLADFGFEVDETFGAVPINPPGGRSYVLVRGKIDDAGFKRVMEAKENGEEHPDLTFWPDPSLAEGRNRRAGPVIGAFDTYPED